MVMSWRGDLPAKSTFSQRNCIAESWLTDVTVPIHVLAHEPPVDLEHQAQLGDVPRS